MAVELGASGEVNLQSSGDSVESRAVGVVASDAFDVSDASNESDAPNESDASVVGAMGGAAETAGAKRSSETGEMTISQLSKEQRRANAIQPDATLPGGRELEEAARAAKRDLSAKGTGKSLRKVPESRKLATFVAYGSHDEPRLKASHARSIKKAIRAIEKTGADCGAVLIDLHSGCGIAYNAGKPVYSASAFKAPFVFYLLEDAGKRGISEGDRASAESAIRHSSNDAYDSLTFPRMGKDYTEWLESYGIEYRADTPFYPYASAKSMARIWADIYQYLKSGTKDAKDAEGGKDGEVANDAKDANDTKGAKDSGGNKGKEDAKGGEGAKSVRGMKSTNDAKDAKEAKDAKGTKDDKDDKGSKDVEDSKDAKDVGDAKGASNVNNAEWFSELLTETNRSYIRDGVAGKGVTVRNKAGWISGDYDASTDCAYIDVKGRPYLMAIMTSQPASQAAFDRVSDLARRLFAARSILK